MQPEKNIHINVFYVAIAAFFGVCILVAHWVWPQFLPHLLTSSKARIASASSVPAYGALTQTAASTSAPTSTLVNVQTLSESAPTTSTPTPAPHKDASAPPKTTHRSVATKTQSPASIPTSIDTIPPSAPDGLAATRGVDTQINLSWNAATDNVGVVGYRIYKDGILIASTIKPSAGIIHLLPSTTYRFTVAAYDAAGNVSHPSVPLSVITKSDLEMLMLQYPTTSPAILQNMLNEKAAIAAGAATSTIAANAHASTASADSSNTTTSSNTSTNGSTVSSGTSGGTPSQTSTPTSAPKTYIISVTSSGGVSPSSQTVAKGDTVVFKYGGSIGDEINITFSPSNIGSIKLDHDTTSKSQSFTSTGTWKCTTSVGGSGTITVQ